MFCFLFLVSLLLVKSQVCSAKFFDNSDSKKVFPEGHYVYSISLDDNGLVFVHSANSVDVDIEVLGKNSIQKITNKDFCSFSAVATYGNLMAVTGCNDVVYFYGLQSTNWTLQSELKLISHLRSRSIALSAEYLLVGGVADDNSASVDSYQLENQVWEFHQPIIDFPDVGIMKLKEGYPIVAFEHNQARVGGFTKEMNIVRYREFYFFLIEGHWIHLRSTSSSEMETDSANSEQIDADVDINDDPYIEDYLITNTSTPPAVFGNSLTIYETEDAITAFEDVQLYEYYNVDLIADYASVINTFEAELVGIIITDTKVLVVGSKQSTKELILFISISSEGGVTSDRKYLRGMACCGA